MQLQTLWHNKMETSNIFQEGDIDPNGNPMTAELAERLNLLNFGDVQDAIHEHTTDKTHYSAYGTDDTWEGEDTSGMGITQELSEEDYDLASFVIEAQKGKIADYLANNEKYLKKLDVVKRAKPLTIKELSLGKIKTENGRKLYNNYETDMSELMNVYTDKDRYTTDNVMLTNTGTSLRDFLIGKPIVAGKDKATILNIKLDQGILSVKVQMGKKDGTLQTSPDDLFKYDLTQPNNSGFYDLIGDLTSALNDNQVINENTRYDRISRNPY
jgi:hypothetical protein